MNFWNEDHRGSSVELIKFLSSKFLLDSSTKVDQIFLSRSKRGVFRGFHYQPSIPQTKYIFVLEGVIDDYLLDRTYFESRPCRVDDYIRHFRLSDKPDFNFLEVSEDLAHGYYVQSDTSLLLYLICGQYDRKDQSVFRLSEDGPLTRFVEEKSKIMIRDAIMSDADR